MKKYMFMAVAGMLALCSCSNDDNDIQDIQNAPRQMTFTAGYNDGATTRATLSGTSVTFDNPDYISILSVNNTNTQFTTSAGGASATFTGTAVDDSKFYAISPYQMFLELDGDVIKNVEIPSNQMFRHTGDTWDSMAPIAYATTEGSSLQFHNVCALLKIHNDVGDDVFINIDCNNGVLTGIFDLDTSTDPATLTVQADKENPMVSLGQVPNNTTIYLAIAPGTVENLNAMYSITEPDKYGIKYKVGYVTFEAGKIYNLGSLSEWESH